MRNSIATKISVIFAIAFSLVCILFFNFARIESEKYIEKIRDGQISAINYLLALYERGNPPQDLAHYFKNFGFRYLDNENLKKYILKEGKIVFQSNTPMGMMESLSYEGRLYLFIKNNSISFLFESSDRRNVNDPLFVGFLISSILLFAFYASVLRSLAPLRKLHSDIKKFASGNMDVAICSTNYELNQPDEIGQVAFEFNNAVCKIKELICSRQLFLRAIMHELKTPIGKGRIVSEMVANDTQKTRLVSVFERLDMLINEFGKIEQLLSKSYSLEYQECHFSLILDQVKDMLMLDNFESKVLCEIKNDALIRVDFQLFSLAIKNLIDNAIKYADDKRAVLVCDERQIVIKNRGKALDYPIGHYKQAFVRGSFASKSSSGMGLGLYIIEQICLMHKFDLKYEYSDGFHCFSVKI